MSDTLRLRFQRLYLRLQDRFRGEQDQQQALDFSLGVIQWDSKLTEY